jgi:hypothetical protein
MRRNWVLRGFGFALLALLFVGVVSAIVMGLWNWLVPPLFGGRAIDFWQAVGLLILARILFGGFRGRGGWHWAGWRHRMRERWAQMTPEERAKFREGVRGRCGWERRDEEQKPSA